MRLPIIVLVARTDQSLQIRHAVGDVSALILATTSKAVCESVMVRSVDLVYD